MALDWSKEISFSGLKKRSPKAKSEYPSKTYINLVIRDKREADMRSMVLKGILIVLVAALFIKFGVFDFYDRVGKKQVELASQQQVLSGLESQLTNYNEVKTEYDMYESSRIVSAEGTVSVHDAMELVDRYIAPSAKIAAIDIKGNTISLSLADVTLDKVGKLVSTLYGQPMVANVSVSTAATEQDTNKAITASMVVTLQVV